MTHGTIALIGPASRETELFVARLEKDRYGVVALPNLAAASKWLTSNSTQAVLFSEKCTRRTIEQLVAKLNSSKRNRFVPAIILAQDELPANLKDIAGIGESFRLHTIPLTKAVARLRLAVQLTQMARQLTLSGSRRT